MAVVLVRHEGFCSVSRCRVRLRSPSRQQRHQAALHSHLLQQRLATEHAVDTADRRQRQQQQHDLRFGAAAPNQRRQQEAALEQRLMPTLDQQLASGQELGLQAGGGGGGPQQQLHLLPRHLAGTASRLLPSHIHAPPGAQFLPEGLGFRGPEGLQLRPADQARMFHSARSLPAHLHQLNEVGGTVCCLAHEGLSGCSGACVRLRHCISAEGACSTSTARVRCRLAQQGLYTLVHPFYLQCNSFLPSIAAAGARRRNAAADLPRHGGVRQPLLPERAPQRHDRRRQPHPAGLRAARCAPYKVPQKAKGFCQSHACHLNRLFEPANVGPATACCWWHALMTSAILLQLSGKPSELHQGLPHRPACAG